VTALSATQNLGYYIILLFWRIRFWNFCVNIIMVCYVMFAHEAGCILFCKDFAGNLYFAPITEVVTFLNESVTLFSVCFHLQPPLCFCCIMPRVWLSRPFKSRTNDHRARPVK